MLVAVLLVAGHACTTQPLTPQAPARADLETEAARVVGLMMSAWNAHDAESYASYLHPEVRVQTLGDPIIRPTGREAMEKASAEFFAKEPSARVEILERIADGSYVIERERMVGLSSGEVFWTTVIVEVRDKQVVHMWILPRQESGVRQ